MNGFEHSHCEAAGAAAYWSGVPRERNPWDADRYPVHREQWGSGWDMAEKEVMEAPPTVPMSEVMAELGNPVG